MYKFKEENIEVYFICYKKGDMQLVETYYDPILNTYNWFFNAYLAYKHWQNNFKNLVCDKLAKMLLTIGASRYLVYAIENKQYKSSRIYNRYLRDLKKIEPLIAKYVEQIS